MKPKPFIIQYSFTDGVTKYKECGYDLGKVADFLKQAISSCKDFSYVVENITECHSPCLYTLVPGYREFYKVVYNDPDTKKLTSRFSNVMMNGCVVEYSIDKWATPKIPGSKLFCFDSRKTAEAWATEPHLQCYTCEVKNPEEVRLISWRTGESDLDKFWLKKDYTNTKFAPSDTILTPTVRLVKMIKQYDYDG